MREPSYPNLDQRYGRENAAKLATAYEAVIGAVSPGYSKEIPSRKMRLQLVEAMLTQASAKGFDVEGLKRAGLGALGQRVVADIAGNGCQQLQSAPPLQSVLP